MIAGLITPAGNLGALTPATTSVKPIAAVGVAVGDVVQFDFQGDSATYTDITKITGRSTITRMSDVVPTAATRCRPPTR